MQTVRTKEVTKEMVQELRGKLRRGDSILIAAMLGMYAPATIKAMINGKRTMKPIVYAAANKLIDTIEQFKNMGL